ncbi:MAG: hypothetical protein LBQ74_09760 [Prevotella sp.]|jgi:hypothetical protein|nr:hypothetical protein [Prevotella sp.]
MGGNLHKYFDNRPLTKNIILNLIIVKQKIEEITARMLIGDTLKFRYNAGSQAGTIREIFPLSIKESKGLVIAKCKISDKNPSFFMNKLYFVLIIFLFFSCGYSGKEISTTDENKVEDRVINGQNSHKKVKLDIFNDVNKTRNLLSSIGLGELSEWKKGLMMEWYECRTILLINGEGIRGDWNRSDITCFLCSYDKDNIQEIELSFDMNSYNKYSAQKGMNKYKETLNLLFKSLSIKIPNNLLNIINQNQKFVLNEKSQSFQEYILEDNDSLLVWLEIKKTITEDLAFNDYNLYIETKPLVFYDIKH